MLKQLIQTTQVPKGGHIILALLIVSLNGCSIIQLPSIDQSGDQVFDGTKQTQFVNPLAHIKDKGCSLWPKAAFEQPARPDPCPPAVVAQPAVTPAQSLCGPKSCLNPLAGCKDKTTGCLKKSCDNLKTKANPVTWSKHFQKGQPGEIKLLPTQVVAPVGSEVILKAGLCGPKGYYLKREPLEWILPQDSVGHFVDVGDDRNQLSKWTGQGVAKKITGDYAVGATASKQYTITRGNQHPNDDVVVVPGQGWVSVTSASAGTSHVTVLAKRADNWDKRRKTAIIHWVDARWRLPASTVVRAGQTVQLTTQVYQASSGAPLEHWDVEYELVTQSGASFVGAPGTTKYPVKTDGEGKASVQLAAPTSGATVVDVVVRVVRPSSIDGMNPRMVVGQGKATIRWSSPDLRITALGPERARVGQPLTYVVEVSNPGDSVSSNVTVSGKDVPPTLQITGSQPPISFRNNELAEWHLGNLPPNTSRRLEVYAIAKQVPPTNSISMVFNAKTGEGLQRSANAVTAFYEPSLKLSVEGNAAANIGDIVTFNIVIENTSRTPGKSFTAVLTDTFGRGLEHDEGQQSPLEFEITNPIEPGKIVKKELKFKVTQPGNLCHRVEVRTSDGQVDQVTKCITVQPPPPAKPTVRARIERRGGPVVAQVGSRIFYRFHATNVGGNAATGVRIVVRFSPNSLVPKNATVNRQYVRGEMSWVLGTVAPQTDQNTEIEFECVAADAQATIQLIVDGDGDVSEQDQTTFAIGAAARRPVNPGPANPGPANPRAGNPGAANPQSPTAGAAGELQVTVTSDRNPMRVGDGVNLTISVKNARRVSDTNVRIRLEYGDAFTAATVTKSNTAPDYSEDNVVQFAPLRELRPGDDTAELPILVRLQAKKAGDHQIKVIVTSDRQTTPVIKNHPTRVLE